MLLSGDSSKTSNVALGHSGQQLHVSGVFIILLELALVIENLLPILVVVVWLPVRGVGDRLIAAFSVTCILSAVVPTPLGLASYFSDGWFGGSSTCTTYQVTSIWCNLSSLALLTYMCVNCNVAVWRLRKIIPPSTSQAQNTFSVNSSSSSSSYSQNHNHLSQAPLSNRASSSTEVQKHQVFHETRDFSTNANSKINSSVKPETETALFSNQKNSLNTNFGSSDPDLACEQFVNETVAGITHNVSDTFLKKSANKSSLDKSTSFDSVKVNSKPSRNHCGRNVRVKEIVENGVIPDLGLQYCTENVTSSHANSFNGEISQPAEKTAQDLHNVSQGLRVTQSSNLLCLSNSSVSGGTTGYVQFGNSDNEAGHDSVRDSNGSCSGRCQPRDYVSLVLFLLYTLTLAISSLPVVGFGPPSVVSETSCRSWIVPLPSSVKEKTFFVVFLVFVYLCLVMGCSSGISVCLQVSKRMRRERKRRSRFYHEEENVPDLNELSVLDAMRRQYSLTCIVMAGLLTWVPIVMMLTLQKSGVSVSEATLMYSNIATSLPGLLNPLLYSLTLDRYRAGYKAILEKCCCRHGRQKSHHLRGVRVHSDGQTIILGNETTLTTSGDGHICQHGMPNPSFDELVEEEDDEDDEDYFPDDSEILESEAKEMLFKPNEKTPLQAVSLAPSSGACRTVLANRVKSPWQRQHESFESSNDKECLLVSRAIFVDEETGL